MATYKEVYKEEIARDKYVDEEFTKHEESEHHKIKSEVDEYQETFKQLDDFANKDIADKTESMSEMFDNQRKATALCSELLKKPEKERDEDTINKLSYYIQYLGGKIAESFSEVSDSYRDSGGEVTPAVMDYGDVMQGHDDYLADIDNYGKGLRKL